MPDRMIANHPPRLTPRTSAQNSISRSRCRPGAVVCAQIDSSTRFPFFTIRARLRYLAQKLFIFRLRWPFAWVATPPGWELLLRRPRQPLMNSLGDVLGNAERNVPPFAPVRTGCAENKHAEF